MSTLTRIRNVALVFGLLSLAVQPVEAVAGRGGVEANDPSCYHYDDWYGYECLSCADYDECEDGWAPWEAACCDGENCHYWWGDASCEPE